MKPSIRAALFLCAIATLPFAGQLEAQAPSFDTSGNHLLSGTYYFRQVIYEVSTSTDTSTGITGELSGAISVYGNITFDGNGNYSISGGTAGGLVLDSSVGTPIPLSCYIAETSCTSGAAVPGTYAVSASGFGYISSPVATGDLIYGLVSSNGVFLASTTETSYAYSDLMVATPLSSPAPGNSTFNGSYSVAAYLPGGNPLQSADAFFQLNADGNGNLGTVNITGYYGGGGTTAITQSNNGVKYFFSGGAGVVTFPTSTTANFYSGQEYLYFSPDGSFFVGGSPQGYDLMIGVRNGSGTQNFAGTYYEAGIDQDVSVLQTTGYANFDGYYGSFNTTPAGQIVAHDRINSPFNAAAFGSTYADSFTPPVTGTYTDSVSSFQYAVGDSGAIRVGAGNYPYLSITVAVQAPSFTPTSSVFINPTGIVNAASFAPFTAGISPGEFLAIYGTNLAAGTVISSTVPYPTTLGNVQVIINGVAAPIYYVTSGQLAVIAPAGNPYNLATIQVINNNVASNVVTVPVNKTTPGVYTLPSGGLGYAAAVDANTGQIVSPSTPAFPGDTVELFATGLGTAYPTVADGAAPPATPLSYTTNTITADVGGTTATVQFAGLAPTLAGLYQVNVVIPATLTSGDYTMDLSGPDSYTSESLISIGSGVSAAADRKPVAAARKHPTVDKSVKRPRLCVGPKACTGQAK